MTRDNDMPDESNRYDGAPAPSRPQPEMPSREEVKTEHRRYLASEGCADCGEDDPDGLGSYLPNIPPSAGNRRGDPSIVLCDEHARERGYTDD